MAIKDAFGFNVGGLQELLKFQLAHWNKVLSPYLFAILKDSFIMLLNKFAKFNSISKDDFAEELLFKIEQNIGIKK